MIDISKLFTDLETSIKLKELGVEQESYAYWQKDLKGEWALGMIDTPLTRTFLKISPENFVSAFSVTELAAMQTTKSPDYCCCSDPNIEAETCIINAVKENEITIDFVNANLKRFWRQSEVKP